jgi:hypothetical protein
MQKKKKKKKKKKNKNKRVRKLEEEREDTSKNYTAENSLNSLFIEWKPLHPYKQPCNA